MPTDVNLIFLNLLLPLMEAMFDFPEEENLIANKI